MDVSFTSRDCSREWRWVLEKLCYKSTVNPRLVLGLLQRIPNLKEQAKSFSSPSLALCYLKSLQRGEEVDARFIPLLEELLPVAHNPGANELDRKLEELLNNYRVELALSKLRTEGRRDETDWTKFKEAVIEMFPSTKGDTRTLRRREELLDIAKAPDKEKAADAALKAASSALPWKKMMEEITNLCKQAERKMPVPVIDMVQKDLQKGLYSLKDNGKAAAEGLNGQTSVPDLLSREENADSDKVGEEEGDNVMVEQDGAPKAEGLDGADEVMEEAGGGKDGGFLNLGGEVAVQAARGGSQRGQGKAREPPPADKTGRGGSSGGGRRSGRNKETPEEDGEADETDGGEEEEDDEGKKKAKDGAGGPPEDGLSAKCGFCHEGGKMVDCDDCRAFFHWDCVDLLRAPRGVWSCNACSVTKGKDAKGKKGAVAEPVPQKEEPRRGGRRAVTKDDGTQPPIEQLASGRGLRSTSAPQENNNSMQAKETRSAGKPKPTETRREGGRSRKNVNYDDEMAEAEEEEGEEAEGGETKGEGAAREAVKEVLETLAAAGEGVGKEEKGMKKVTLDGKEYDAVDGHIEVCFKCNTPGELICCDLCPAACHFACAGLRRGVKLPSFVCMRQSCQVKSKKRARAAGSEDAEEEGTRSRRGKSLSTATKTELEESNFSEDSRPRGKDKSRAETPPSTVGKAAASGGTPGRTPLRGHRRKNLVWSKEEVDIIMEGVIKFPSKDASTSGAKGGRPAAAGQPDWKRILNLGAKVFHSTRSEKDLYDKWRNLKKYAKFMG